MRIYLFNRADSHIRPAFRTAYILQNLKVVKYISSIYFVINAAVGIVAYAFHLDINQITHIHNFQSSLNAALFAMPVFYATASVLIINFKLTKLFLRVSQLSVLLFTLFMISRGMLNSFHTASHDPRNSITMYMIWLVVIGVFFVFEFYETIFIAVICLVSFSVLLPYFQNDTIEILRNNLASVTLIVIFFCVSRYSFSYMAGHFIQLTTIQEKNVQIENANHLKDEILAIVAHDLRNPLAAIESVVMIMEMEEENISEEHKDYLNLVKASCHKAQIIINDLIEAARNQGDDSFAVEKTDLDSFLKEIVDEWTKSKTEHLKVVYNSAGHAVYANINKEKIQRVIDNLIINAAKFTVKSDRIDVFLKQTHKECIIEVKDYGIGIPQDLLPYIFDRFSRAGRKGVHGEDSVGLGLNIVRQIIRKHRGDITIESLEQQGTTVIIKLPQALGSLPAA